MTGHEAKKLTKGDKVETTFAPGVHLRVTGVRNDEKVPKIVLVQCGQSTFKATELRRVTA